MSTPTLEVIAQLNPERRLRIERTLVYEGTVRELIRCLTLNYVKGVGPIDHVPMYVKGVGPVPGAFIKECTKEVISDISEDTALPDVIAAQGTTR